MRQRIILLLGIVSFSFVSLFVIQQRSPYSCSDLIEEFENLPSELKLIGCEKTFQAPEEVFVARYQVVTNEAKKIEGLLIDRYGMSPLKFVCCGWENRTNPNGKRFGFYQGDRGYFYQIAMNSGKLKNEQKPDWNWSSFDRFCVTITAYQENP